MVTIERIQAREILDSRGFPTVEVEMKASDGAFARASVPSGASTGSREAIELRDGDKSRYAGKGVRQAVAHVHEIIAPALLKKTIDKQLRYEPTFDEILFNLDGTEDKSKLGANAILASSIALLKLQAQVKQIPLYQFMQPSDHYFLPVPMMNVLNGGAHADNNLDFQEFMIIPVGASSFQEALRHGAEVFYALKALLKRKGLSTAIGDEGGFAPDLHSHEEALTLLMHAIEAAGLKPGQDVYLALDMASSEFYAEDRYEIKSAEKLWSGEELVDYIDKIITDYPILSIEDAAAEQDWATWAQLTQRCGDRVQLVGDDLFVTRAELLQRGIEQHVANAILIKPNQIGTVAETLSAITLAKQANYATVISHRSGETEDTFIADLAVATQAMQIKTGSLCRTDRTAKYNQLLRIEEELGTKGKYAGKLAFERLKG